jgi:hypothetical protein
MRTIALLLLVLTLVACGNGTATQRPPLSAQASQAIPTPPQAQPIPLALFTTPTVIPPVVSTTTAKQGLGLSRTQLEFLFRNSSSRVTFENDAKTADGTAAIGTLEAKGITVHLLGDPDDIQEVQVKADFDQGAGNDETMVVLQTLMQGMAPTIKNSNRWLRDHFQQARRKSPDITIEGRYAIAITVTEQPRTLLVSVRPARM